ncbi:MAG: amidohydrolase family protein [Clostridia bacterium]|nr:amidohydrolase family protein [Clostridia bacterium]
MYALKGNIVHAPKFGEVEITENGFITIDDGRIEGIYPKLPDGFSGIHVIDYSDKLILQSFCDMHLHAPQYPMLGMGLDLPLLEWLKTYTFKTEAAFSDNEYAKRVYARLAKELVDSGTTRVCMFSSVHTDATVLLMNELEKAGITGYVGKVNMDRNSDPCIQETTEQSMRETLRWLNGCDVFTKIKPMLTPRFTPSCTNELLEWIGSLAKERNLPIQSHLSENLAEMDWVKELHPDCEQYWESYAKYGLFGERTIMAHCVHCDDREIAALKSNKVTVAHCPDSNINLASGIAPIRKMIECGVSVALGSDIAGGAHLSMTEVIASAIRASKMKRIQSEWQTEFLSVAEGYYLGTTAGAKFFGFKDGFASGDMFHAVVIDDSNMCNAKEMSVMERFERSIYLAKKEDIVAVYSDGIKIK